MYTAMSSERKADIQYIQAGPQYTKNGATVAEQSGKFQIFLLWQTFHWTAPTF